MESVLWSLRTQSAFSTLAPILGVVSLTLVMFWDYPLMLGYLLARRALGLERTYPGAQALSTLVVIPSLLRTRDELTSMLSTVESVAHNGYPGPLLIVVSIDGTDSAPKLYEELQAWAQSRSYDDHTWLYVTGTPDRRSKPMAIDHAVEHVKAPSCRGRSPILPRGVREHGCRRRPRP